MEGVNEPSELRGIIPNTFEHIFDHIALNGSKDKYLVRASYFEIYNEEIRDLLSSKPQISLELKESPDSGVYVKDLTSTVVKSVEEIDNVLQKGKKNRIVGATLMNAGSSRSHSVFSIVVECCSSDEQGEHIRVGKLNLVDLAGSERQSKTGATGERLKEATKINLSLSALGNVISALVDGKSQHIPYRDSKLTRILQDSLGGNTKTVMCANAGPADYNYDESLSTLRYANRAKNIKNKPVINEDPKDAMLREYQEQIARLKERLAQMPTSSSPPAASDRLGEQEKEAIIDELRSKANQENEAIRAKTNAELQKLKSANHQTAEEREKLAKKLAEEKQARIDTENQKIQLRQQLKEMEAKLVVGGEFADAAKKQEAELRRANQELALKAEQELVLSRKIAEKEDEKLYLEEKYSSLADEVKSKTKKLKKLWVKYQQAKTEIQDLEREFLVDKNETVDTIRDLTKQLKLKEFIISSFVPPKVSIALIPITSLSH
jgi:kinesin family protein 3/17